MMNVLHHENISKYRYFSCDVLFFLRLYFYNINVRIYFFAYVVDKIVFYQYTIDKSMKYTSISQKQ